MFYFTCNHVWNWNKIISAAEKVLYFFQNHFSDTEHVEKYSWVSHVKPTRLRVSLMKPCILTEDEPCKTLF